jgi:C_GCAxxG_C_C family probable redox protein
MTAVKNDARRVFLKKGTCSQTLCYLLDREFGYLKENEERAADPLAGGLMQGGQQCGMLWGAALAAGAESYRRHADRDQAIGAAMAATRHLVDSFEKRTGSVNCRDITGCDFTSKFGLLKALFLGRFIRCFRLAGRWAPEAIQAATTGLALAPAGLPEHSLSCASEVVRLMGGNDEAMVMVAGFAGGIGLSGNGCGALAAAIWMHTLAWCKEHPGETPPMFKNPETKNIFQAFTAATHAEILCHKITGRRFKSIGEHSEFIKSGGCDKLIRALARSQATATESN